MNATLPDLRVIACNLRDPTSTAGKGALAYVLRTNPGGGHDRIVILVRSRSGRWVEKREAMSRLCNFRLKTLPPDSPRFWDRAGDGNAPGEESLEQLRQACEREQAR